MGIFDIFSKKDPVAEVVQQVRKETILVIDDDKFIRESYQELLTQEGYNVASAVNGKEGLMKAVEIRPNLIMLDIMMPEMDGNMVLEALWKDPRTKTIPVIMLTNAGNIKNMDHAKFFSAFKFMVKVNVSPEEVISSVREGLEVDKRIRQTLGGLDSEMPQSQ